MIFDCDDENNSQYIYIYIYIKLTLKINYISYMHKSFALITCIKSLITCRTYASMEFTYCERHATQYTPSIT